MSDTYKGLTRAQWRYRILDFNGHLYDRSDLVGYTSKQLYMIHIGKLRLTTKKSSKTIQKNTAAVAAARSSAPASMKLTQKQVNNIILIMGL
jgi:hypothetical protein